MQKIGGLFSRKMHQTRARSKGNKTLLEMTTFLFFLTRVPNLLNRVPEAATSARVPNLLNRVPEAATSARVPVEPEVPAVASLAQAACPAHRLAPPSWQPWLLPTCS